jgi:hypothetical protein
LKTADLTAAVSSNSYVKARYINSKAKKEFLIPIRGLLNLGIVQMVQQRGIELNSSAK